MKAKIRTLWTWLAKEENARALGTCGTGVTIVVTIVGLIGIYLNLGTYLETQREYVAAQQQDNRKKQEELISKLYFADIDLNKLLIDHPDLERALYFDPDGQLFKSF